jgi:hypothetical protein
MSESASAPSSEYVEVLHDMRDAAEAEESYDAYGFAEYFPATQRAAVHAFCFIADTVSKDPEGESINDSSLTNEITRKAEADLESERNIVAPHPTRKAIRKLQAVLEMESLGHDLAEHYVRACYR